MLYKRNRFYLFFILISFVGYLWLYFNLKGYIGGQENAYGFCIFKEVTGIPCPSCGSTRALGNLIKGNIKEALYWNPLGFLIGLIMLVLPPWLLYDLLLKKQSFMLFYKRIETILQLKYVAIPAALLIILNWIWNIKKGL